MATHSHILALKIPWAEENWWATVHGFSYMTEHMTEQLTHTQ